MITLLRLGAQEQRNDNAAVNQHVAFVMQRIRRNGDRIGVPHDIGLERHQGQGHDDGKDHDADAQHFVGDGLWLDEPTDHFHHKIQRRTGDEGRLGQGGKGFGLTMAEPVLGVGGL